MREEFFPTVDEEGNHTGFASRSECHNGSSMLLHPVVHLHLFNSKGQLFLQKRALTKDIQPGRWDTSVGGHFAPGEKPEDALVRESEEELSIMVKEALFLGKYIWQSERERELVYSYMMVTDRIPVTDRDEIDDGRFWDIDEIEEALGKGLFTPNFEEEFVRYREKLRKPHKG